MYSIISRNIIVRDICNFGATLKADISYIDMRSIPGLKTLCEVLLVSKLT